MYLRIFQREYFRYLYSLWLSINKIRRLFFDIETYIYISSNNKWIIKYSEISTWPRWSYYIGWDLALNRVIYVRTTEVHTRVFRSYLFKLVVYHRIRIPSTREIFYLHFRNANSTLSDISRTNAIRRVHFPICIIFYTIIGSTIK